MEPVRRLPRPVPLAEIKKDPKLKDFPLVRIPRLSVMPVTDEQWKRIERMTKASDPMHRTTNPTGRSTEKRR